MPNSELSALPVGGTVESFKIKSILSVRADTITYVGYNPQIRRNVTITEFLPQQVASRASNGQSVDVIPEYNNEFEHALSAFLQQARAWSQIHDPHIIRVTHYFQANGTAYLVMDYEKFLFFVFLHQFLALPGSPGSVPTATRATFRPRYQRQ